MKRQITLSADTQNLKGKIRVIKFAEDERHGRISKNMISNIIFTSGKSSSDYYILKSNLDHSFLDYGAIIEIEDEKQGEKDEWIDHEDIWKEDAELQDNKSN